jgi:hypothetical protein
MRNIVEHSFANKIPPAIILSKPGTSDGVKVLRRWENGFVTGPQPVKAA